MAFWSWLTGAPPADGPKKKATRGKSRPPDERLKALRVRYLQKLERENPALYHELMQQDLGIAAKTQQDKLDEFVETLKKLKDAGVLPRDMKQIGEGSNVKELAEIAMTVFGAMAAQRAAAGPGYPTAYPPASAEPEPASPTAGQPSTPPFPPTAKQAPPSAGQAAKIDSEVPMSLISAAVISQLDGRSPEQAATWLLSQNHPQAKALVEALCRTPDDRLPELLNTISQQAPDFAGLIAWLRGRQSWLVDTVRAVRRQAGGEGAVMGL